MKNTIKIILLSAIFAVLLNIATTPAFAGLASFKTALIAAVQANFTAGQQTEIRNSFVSAYQTEWDARVRAGTADTAANRGNFAADKIIDYVNDVRNGELKKAAITALPTPTPLPQE
jgi:hypothetical protein